MTTHKLKGTIVLLLALAGTNWAAAQALDNLYRITDGSTSNAADYQETHIPAGGQIVLADLKGPGKITYFYLTDLDKGRFAPGLVIKAYWDEEQQPSINVPLGDFFGAFNRTAIDFQSLPMQTNHYCFMCYLPMPFSTRARIVLANDGDEDYHKPMAYSIDYERDPKYALEPSRLHVQWKRSNPVQEGMHTLLEVRGKGQYVGNFLQVYSTYNGWWGEGDTIFHVDEHRITHTPGTEDEYGACWEFGHKFAYAYSGYLQNDNGHNRMYRWYLANPVRFQKSLKVEMQNQRGYRGRQTPSSDDYTSVVFWYQTEPHQPFTLPPYAERIALSRAATYPPRE
jgi:hypothetical protein